MKHAPQQWQTCLSARTPSDAAFFLPTRGTEIEGTPAAKGGSLVLQRLDAACLNVPDAK